jgi:hypothetical protein
VAAPAPPPPPRIELLTVTRAIAGVAVVDGQGCVSGAPVTVMVDGEQVSNAVADGEGDFQTKFSTGTTPAGKHMIEALCGPTLNAALDIVLVSEVGTPAGPTMAIILMFLLMIGWLQRDRLASAAKSLGR